MKTLGMVFMIHLMATFSLVAQVRITGRVTDTKGGSLAGANVSVKGTYDGASADTGGYFSFTTSDTGRQILMASYVGYKVRELEIDLSCAMKPLHVALEEQAGEIQSVVITAGAFETGDLKRPVALKPMDIATTPSAVGDIYGTLTTLPGAQIVGNEGGLYVRGGEGYETKTFIDGMLVNSPYMSKMPDLPTRSRFSPILFTGVAFSTGGYTAEYGQALSSAINLSTSGIAEKSQGAVSLMSVGMSGSYTKRWENASLSGTLQYINMKPYYSLFKQNLEWKKPAEQLGGTLLFRQKMGKYGMLKVFVSNDNSHSSLYYSNPGESQQASLIDLKNTNGYLNAVYNAPLSETWYFKTGLAVNYDNNNTGMDANRLTEISKAFQHRITLSHDVNRNISLRFGEEVSWHSFNRDYYAADSGVTYGTGISLTDYAAWVEPEFKINKNLVLRTGLRSEYNPGLKEFQAVPRISMAYHAGDYSQFSMAYGMFRQQPESRYLLFGTQLHSEKATHLIVNYQHELNDRIFRVELYRKWYSNLVKYRDEYSTDPADFSNAGSGNAQGIDVFWRDSRSVRDLDYWISYSYVQSKRNYKDYQRSRTPSFISPHTLSVVVKYYIRKMDTYTGCTYMFASPKTYYNAALPASAGDETRAYNDLSLNITCIRPMLGTYCAILLNVSNVLGFNNVYGYNYSTHADDQGFYTRYPIKPQSKRFFVLGAYLIL
jgi:hypothetical protein